MEAYPQPKKRSKLKIVLLALGLLFLCGLFVIGLLIFKGYKETPAVTATIESFLQDTSNGNLDGAYTLTAQEFKNSTPRAEFARTMNVTKAQFTDFEKLELVGFNRGVHNGQSYYQYSGTLTYTDSNKGDISALLIKENNEWKIVNIKIEASIDRLEKFQQLQEPAVLGISADKISF